MVSVNRLRNRKSDFPVNDWILDSGAFSELLQQGHYRSSTQEYASQVLRWSRCGNLLAAVSQDYMCEPFIVARTGLSVQEHQHLTIERYLEIRDSTPGVYILPVLQGYYPSEYLAHLDKYGDALSPGQWVGVGSVCKRNANVDAIEEVLVTIQRARPDLLLHGFGVKTTALSSSIVRNCLHSADSMAWSFAARKHGRDANSWIEAKSFADGIATQIDKKRTYEERLFTL